MTDLITVVLPVYNVKDYLERAVESVLKQTYTNLEVLLIDDGSTDGSAELCDALALRDERVRVIHKENTGVSDTRNLGIAVATGAYLTFIDSDDYVETTYVERMYEELRKAGVQVAVSFMTKVFEDGHRETLSVCQTAKDVCVLSGEQALQHISDRTYPVVGFCWGTLFDVAFLREHNVVFDTTIKLCEDMLFKCQLYLQDVQVVVVHEALYVYCIRENSATGSALYNTDRLLSELKARKEMAHIADRWPGSACEQRVQVRLFHTYLNLLKSVALTGQYRESVALWVCEMKEAYQRGNRHLIGAKSKMVYALFLLCPGVALRFIRLFYKN